MEGLGCGSPSVPDCFISTGTDFCSGLICSIMDFLTATVFFSVTVLPYSAHLFSGAD